MTTGINWKVSKEDADLIAKIVERASVEFSENVDRMTLTMDVTAAHGNGCPLDLDSLLTAERYDFMHDISGINRHIDRDTGVLMDCFLPRYSRKEA